jgi:predicted nucleic-acid-binding Zn-ribbon protein
LRLIFKCPKCDSTIISEKWIDVTKEYLGHKVDNCSIYYCPWCGEQSNYEELASEWDRIGL